MKKGNVSFLTFFFALFYIYSYSSKLITIDDGLSSRQVYSIEKGKIGFMWFLTQDGVNRYNGLTTTLYKLESNGEEINASPEISTLRKDSKGRVLELNKNGYIFRYNYTLDKFELLTNFKYLNQKAKLISASSIFLDSKDRVWINVINRQYIFDSNTKVMTPIEEIIKDEIVDMDEIDDNIYSIASTERIYTILLKGNKPKILSIQSLPSGSMVNYIFYHKNSNQLIISTPFNGLYIYNYITNNITNVPYKLKNIFVNKIVPYGISKDEVLIATNGTGTYILNIKKNQLTKFYNNINDNFKQEVSSNIVKDIFIDEHQKIWMAVYPFGITVSSDKEQLFKIIKHYDYNSNSLVDNQVNFIYEDSDKDIWFLTNNGISCYNKMSDKWRNILYDAPKKEEDNNRVFLSMTEISPGKFLISGYMAGVYYINKNTMKAIFMPIVDSKKEHLDKYIRSIYRDNDSTVWLGGYSYLKSYNVKTKKYKIYNINTSIYFITSKSENELWIGTYNGLYIFNKRNNKLYNFKFSSKVENITSVYQYKDSLTFIGTNGNGLFLYNNVTKKKERYFDKNSALNSNFIYNIIPSTENSILISTEEGLSRYNISQRKFMNWTSEQGLTLTKFNPTSGIKTSDNEYYFGSSKGAIMFTNKALRPIVYKTKMIFNSLYINYQKVYPGEKGSPLEFNIDQTENLYLNNDQNTFTIELASINYDNQSSIYYSWFIEGLYDKWTVPSQDKTIKCINLPAGKYRLKVKSILIEDEYTLEERNINIYVGAPFWVSTYAQIVYLIIILTLVYYISRYIVIRKERNMSNDKIRFFINTAHDIRTPLSLIKAPLGEILRSENLTLQGEKNLKTALDNTEILTNLTNNLINFEKEELYSHVLNVTECNLNEYINDYMSKFVEYAQKKKINIEIHNNSDANMKVLIDKNKIDSILRNIISNAIKYTEEKGLISVLISNEKKYWTIQISDTGIGISEKDQKKLFKQIFRSYNATNMKISGAGIGLVLTYKLIKNHQGKISVTSCENIGTTFKISFPFKSSKYILSKKADVNNETTYYNPNIDNGKKTNITILEKSNINKRYILIVDDNSEMRSFLVSTLSDKFKVSEASNGLEALSMIKLKNPELIISDIMMPIMDGNELCQHVKDNIETSHIPIILLTALHDKDSIIKGLQNKADKYITKPFEIQLLIETINNIFANRDIIKIAFSKGNFSYIQDNDQPSLDLDQQFLLKVSENIKNNLSKEINVDILCSYLNMSRSSFYNKIKALTDYSPSDYIRKIRMEEAARLLRTKNYTVSEVADMVGFGDPKYFTDIFKKYFNITPSRYMKNN